MINPNSTEIDDVLNLQKALDLQVKKLNKIREQVRDLAFTPIETVGFYSTVAYKAIDGGKMHISFEPLRIDLIEVADSYGNLKMRFVVPKESDEDEAEDKSFLESDPLIANFIRLLGKEKLSEITELLNNSDTLMELSEWACIFDKIIKSKEEPVILMRDGLLRTKKIKAELIQVLWKVLKENKKMVKLVGVSKTSRVIDLLSAALAMEHKFPERAIGFIKIPRQLELLAYRWSGSGKINTQTDKLNFAFGDIYIAKLSRTSNLLVTLEIPYNLKTDEEIYSPREVIEIIAHLSKDSMYSYPVIGYPQTIMRAHEAAARIGFPSSVIRDKVLDQLKEKMDEDGKNFMRDAEMINEFVSKGVLGGGSE